MHRFVAALLLAAIPTLASAASLAVGLRDEHGAAVPGTVAWAVPDGRKPAPPARTAILDQRNRQFVPHILVVQTGTAVRFPTATMSVTRSTRSLRPKSFSSALRRHSCRAGRLRQARHRRPRLHHPRRDERVRHRGRHAVLRLRRAELPSLSKLPDGKYVVHVWYEGCARIFADKR